MSLLTELPKILQDAEREYRNACAGRFRAVKSSGEPGGNMLFQGDTMAFMKYLAAEKDLKGRIDLIYVDPPFLSKANYQANIKIDSSLTGPMPSVRPVAYDDRWTCGKDDYLRMLSARIFMMRDLLAEDGCFWIHLDWHVVHYVKIIMDEIFGEKAFANEIIWQYKSGGTSKNHFSRKHDTLLFYKKGGKCDFSILKEKSYNRGRKPYRFKGVKEYRDDEGWYTMVNMKDVWQIDMVGRTSSERTGYATQKPEALLSRIIESCSREGDLCADFFCGAGTMAAVAEKSGRKWIACDAGGLAISSVEKRMAGITGGYLLLQEENGEKEAGGEVRIEAGFHEAPFSGRKLLKVSVTDYIPYREKLPLEEKDRDTVMRIAEADPLQLIDLWSIDFDYDGSVHKADMTFIRERTGIQSSCEKILKSCGRINIRVSDIFGNSFAKTFCLES